MRAQYTRRVKSHDRSSLLYLQRFLHLLNDKQRETPRTMPSDLSYWLISAPLKDGDPDIMLDEVSGVLAGSVEVGRWEVPELKVGFV